MGIMEDDCKSYGPNFEWLEFKIKQAGLSVEDFARKIGVGTWRVKQWIKSPQYVLVGEYEKRVARTLRLDLETLRRAISNTHFDPPLS
jgi:hypothetical protein